MIVQRRWCALLLVVVVTGAACRADDDREARPAGARSTTNTVPDASTTTTTTTTAVRATEVPSHPGRRRFHVRNVQLGRGAALGVASHPDGPTYLRGNDDLEVCQATTAGEIDLSGGSWPGASGFDECIPFVDTRAVVPATPVNSYHVGFAVRARDGGAAAIEDLTVTYRGVDQFLFVAFPPVAPREVGPIIAIEPRRSSTVVVAALTFPDFGDVPGARVVASQGGETLHVGGPDPRYEGLVYGPATPGRPVEIALTVPGAEAAHAGLLLQWA
jgi:hypothetical protein